MLQLSCAWTLAQPAVACVAPTLIQEAGPPRRRSRPSAPSSPPCPASRCSTQAELDAIAAIGDNTGCMKLKGASPVHEGEERPDAWPLDDELREIGRRFGIEADRDLVSS